MKKIGLCLLLFFFSISIAIAGTIKEVIIFGDSLSDNGNLYNILKIIPKSPPYYDGRFTNGPTWAEHVGNYYYSKNYATVENYAYGGATAVVHHPLKDHYVAPVILQEELDGYLLKSIHNDKTNTLYVLWIGANDYLYEKTSDIGAVTDQVVNKISDFLTQLIHEGGRTFLILNLPDLSSTPFARENNNGERLKNLTVAHNQKLNLAINILKEQYQDTQFATIDIFYILNDMVSHLDKYNSQYGTHVSNVTDTCWSGDWWGRSGSLLSTEVQNTFSSNKVTLLNRTLDQKQISQMIMSSPTLAISYRAENTKTKPCEDADSYLFWDVLHPTAIIHQVLGDIVIEALEKQNIN